jgi:hypothetical protein
LPNFVLVVFYHIQKDIVTAEENNQGDDDDENSEN